VDDREWGRGLCLELREVSMEVSVGRMPTETVGDGKGPGTRYDSRAGDGRRGGRTH